MNDLNPTRLRRLLAELELSKAILVDAIRGRSIKAADVVTLRSGVTGIHGVLRALDETKPWAPPPEPPPVEEPEPDQAPTVNAGPDQTIGQLSTLLDGTASDDGGSVTTNWSQVSGPGVVSFGSALSLSTTASFSLPGTYVLRLTAYDATLAAFDELTVEVVI